MWIHQFMRPGSAKSIRAHKSCKAFLRCVRQQGADGWHRCRNITFSGHQTFCWYGYRIPFFTPQPWSCLVTAPRRNDLEIWNETMKLTQEMKNRPTQFFWGISQIKFWKNLISINFPNAGYIHFFLFEIRLPTTPHESLWPDPQQNSLSFL